VNLALCGGLSLEPRLHGMSCEENGIYFVLASVNEEVYAPSG
jgi:hypothetical protein